MDRSSRVGLMSVLPWALIPFLSGIAASWLVSSYGADFGYWIAVLDGVIRTTPFVLVPGVVLWLVKAPKRGYLIALLIYFIAAVAFQISYPPDERYGSVPSADRKLIEASFLKCSGLERKDYEIGFDKVYMRPFHLFRKPSYRFTVQTFKGGERSVTSYVVSGEGMKDPCLNNKLKD